MKPTLLKATLLISAVFALTACNNDQSVSKVDKVESKEQQRIEPVRLDKKLIPDGHWLVNSHFCKKQLPSLGVYDFKIEQDKFTKIGISQDGKWYQSEEPKFKEVVLQSLSDENFKCAAINEEKLVFARYEAVGTAMNIAFEPGAKYLITQTKDTLDLAVIFDVEILKNFEFIQIDDLSSVEDVSEEESLPSEENQ